MRAPAAGGDCPELRARHRPTIPGPELDLELDRAHSGGSDHPQTRLGLTPGALTGFGLGPGSLWGALTTPRPGPGSARGTPTTFRPGLGSPRGTATAPRPGPGSLWGAPTALRL